MAVFLFSDSANWITGQVFVSGPPGMDGVHAADMSFATFALSVVPIASLCCFHPRQVVDGGENHVRVPQLPYPQAVLDPKSMMDRIQAKI